MKLTIFTLLSIASTLVSASGGLALRAGNCPAAASKICGSGAGGLKDCCPQGTMCTFTTAAPTSTRTGYTTITALPTTTGIVTDSAPIPNITMTGAAAGPPDFHRGVSVGGWLGALVLGYLAL
ncbi:hypothetical protein HOY82DRAFT_618057 [Tuber indicum]|nr:hypothetical protein HOY82DRAFT_618057 [Tuber indicum]